MKNILNYSFLLFVAGVGLFVPYIGLLLFPLMFTIIILSYSKGRFFCGNYCPHGMLFDSLIFKLSRKVKVPKLFTGAILATLYFIYFMSMFTMNIYNAYISDDFLQTLSFGMANMYFVVTVVGVTLGLLFSHRTFCHFCPQGTIQKGVMKISHKKHDLVKVQMTDQSSCVTCRLCNKNCPMEIEVIDEMIDLKLQNANCIKCRKCVEVCPKNILYLG